MFFFLRLIVELAAPLNFSILLLTGSLFFLFANRRKISTTFLVLGIFVLLFCGYGVGLKEYIYNQENRFPPLTDNRLAEIKRLDIKHVVVLGSGHVSDNRLPVTAQIGGASLYRLIEGIRIQRLLPDSKLVVSGGIGYDPIPNALVVKSVANSLGVSSDQIIVEDRPRDTMGEAECMYSLIGESEFVLVSSALHMARAITIFKNRGMHPIAAPTDYIIKKHVVKPAGDIFPSIKNLELFRRIIYEWIGNQWIKLKGFIKNYR